eukprot:Rmarinus@m.26729
MGCGVSKSPRGGSAESANPVMYGGDGPEIGPLTEQEIQDRIVCSEEVETVLIPSHNYRIHCGFVCQRGFYPGEPDKKNQDSYCVHTNFDDDPNEHFFGVFDGHGQYGTPCSNFARDYIPESIKKSEHFKTDFQRAYREAFVSCNSKMHFKSATNVSFDDTLSGTTAITIYIKGKTIYVANVGDSRAVIAERRNNRLIAFDLSKDQTPYRDDERARVRRCGARVLSIDQLEGLKDPNVEDWGDEDNDTGDPPRLWAYDRPAPGCAFTRSIGDSFAEQIGVCAEPEVLVKDLTPRDEFLIIASDGVFEFMPSQLVVDIVSRCNDPLQACKAVVSEAYRLWLQYEVRTDDITMICLFLDGLKESDVLLPEAAVPGPRLSLSASGIRVGQQFAENVSSRPVRRGLSKEKKKKMSIYANGGDAGDDDLYVIPENLPNKSPEEIERISAAVKTNFLFSHLNTNQKTGLFRLMDKREVQAGQVIIKQGDPGHEFFVVESGTYDVYKASEGQEPAADADVASAPLVYTYKCEGAVRPSFGELALMYGAPRAASIVARTDGQLWVLDRRAFRSVLMKSSSQSIVKILKSVTMLESLQLTQLQRLSDILTETSYEAGQDVISEGEMGHSFYIIKEGQAVVTKLQDGKRVKLLDLGESGYFGERALLHDEPRAATVTAVTPLKCLYIGREAFEEVLGPLKDIIDSHRRKRESVALMQMQARDKYKDFSRASLTWKETIQSFSWGGVGVIQVPHSKEVLTIKVSSKSAEDNAAGRVQRENEILADYDLTSSCRFIPTTLAISEDTACTSVLLQTRLVCELDSILRSAGETQEFQPVSEASARFLIGQLVLMLEACHNHELVFRGIEMDSITLDSNGYIQIVHFRNAKPVSDRTYTLCGNPLYLSPEQVQGVGHDRMADWWSLGVLIYEIMSGDTPFSDETDNQMKIFKNISAHVYNGLRFPKSFSEPLRFLITELLHPTPSKRLGHGGPADVIDHAWFRDVDFESLAERRMDAPREIIDRLRTVEAETSVPDWMADVFKE